MPINNMLLPVNSVVCAYVRDSGGSDQDLSIDQQEEEIKTWCLANNLILSIVFRDAAISGSSVVGRQGFQEMINYFHSGCIEKGLVIWRFSRFARDINDAQFYKADLRRRGYEIIAIKDKIPDGATGRLIEAAFDWMNEIFLVNLSIDVKRGQRHLVEKFGALGGFPPYGFRRDPIVIGKRRDGRPHIVHRWLPVEDSDVREKIITAWELRADGAKYSDIHRRIPIYKVPKNFYRFFRNTIYKGVLTYSDHEYQNYCEPIVNKSLWDQVQMTLR